MPDAIVRQELAKLPGVTRTWFEWEIDAKGHSKTLVVEVAFDTDPNNADHDTSALDDIRSTVLDTLQNKTTMIVSRVKVIPADKG